MALSCFITASANQDTSAVREVLESHGVSVVDAFEFRLGEKLLTGLGERIRRSSFFIAILSSASPEVYFEMGIAKGMGKPILVLGQPEDSFPFLQTQPHMRVSTDDRAMLGIVVSQFIEEVRSGKARVRKPTAPVKPAKSWRRRVEGYLQEIDHIRLSRRPNRFERMVGALLQEVGTGATKNEFRTSDKGVDFALWDDRLSQTLGNPLLIELKQGHLTEGRLEQAEAQLKDAIVKADAPAALLLYLDSSGKRFPDRYKGGPLVLRWDFEDFLCELLTHTFEEVVLAKRNRTVHSDTV